MSRLRKYLTPSTFIAFVALIFALTGGAFAASSGGGGGLKAKTTVSAARVTASASKAKAKPKAKAGPRGPAGPAGKNGVNGTAGAPGAIGPGGPAGAAGGIGPIGPQGPAGSTGPAGANGTNGTNGTTGFTETLPSGKTLKGDWGVVLGLSSTYPDVAASSAVSFGIPLKEAPTPHLISPPSEAERTKGEFPTPPPGCTGNVEKPGAEAGNLCVFAQEETDVANKKVCAAAGSEAAGSEPLLACVLTGGSTPETADPYGFLMVATAKEAGLLAIAGTWAVTAK